MDLMRLAAEVERTRVAMVTLAVPASRRRAEVRTARELAEVLAPALAEIVAGLERLGRVPIDVVSQQVLLAPLGRVAARYAEVLAERALETATNARRVALTELIAAGMDITVVSAKADVPEEFSLRVRELIRSGALAAADGTISRMSDDILSTISQAWTEGLGVRETAERLTAQAADMTSWQVRRTARLEMNGAANMASVETWREAGVGQHEWITALDERVRESHSAIHGSIVRVGDPFPNGLTYPCDPLGAPEEIYGCRCTTAPVLTLEGQLAGPVPAPTAVPSLATLI